MGPEGAVNIVHKRELDKAPKRARKLRQEKIAEFRERFANPVRRRRARLHRRGH
jgi:acetyl-CoA carboxylase carboxyltransferase component